MPSSILMGAPPPMMNAPLARTRWRGGTEGVLMLVGGGAAPSYVGLWIGVAVSFTGWEDALGVAFPALALPWGCVGEWGLSTPGEVSST